MSERTTGGVYDEGLNRIYALEGDWCGGTVYQFHLCEECGKWEGIACAPDLEWFIGFRGSCKCDEHWLWFDVIWERWYGPRDWR